MKIEITKLEKGLSIPRRILNKFDIHFNPDALASPNIESSIKSDKINEEINSLGLFVFLTSKKDISPEKLIAIYKNRDTIEKQFFNWKSGLDCETPKTHNDRTTEGKTFVAFIALILRSILYVRKSDNDNTKNLTVVKILNKLNMVAKMIINGDIHFSTLSKTQREIFEAMGIPIDFLE
jgi:transposase